MYIVQRTCSRSHFKRTYGKIERLPLPMEMGVPVECRSFHFDMNGKISQTKLQNEFYKLWNIAEISSMLSNKVLS